MSKKVVDGIEISDDMPVSEYDGKFSGTFDMDPEGAASMAYDDVVHFVVTTRLDNYGFKPTKFGDLKRVNTFKVESVRPVTGSELNKMHQQPVEVYQPVTFDEPKVSPAPLSEKVADPYEEEDDEVFVPEQRVTKVPSAFEDPNLVHSEGRDYRDPILKSFLEGL